MKFDVETANEKTQSVGTDSVQMKLDKNSSAMVYQMFIKSQYSDKTGSVVREITSNCYDAHTELSTKLGQEVTTPVLVKLNNDTIANNYSISFIDKGIGMSPYRVNEVFGTFFKSTKTTTNEQIGGFGIGGKVPLAYGESFFITTVTEKENELIYLNDKIKLFNGHFTEIAKLANINGDFLSVNVVDIKINQEVEKYLKQNKFKNVQFVVDKYNEYVEWKEEVEKSDLPRVKGTYTVARGASSPEIHREPTQELTDDHTGTEVQVPIKSSDKETFARDITKQLFYFENIYFEGFDEGYYGVENNYTIYKGENFLYRKGEKNYSHYMHICLGKVAYPINYDVLGLNAADYQVPVALNFNIGELQPISSRELLDYAINEDEDYNPIKIIKRKLEAAKAELATKLGKQHLGIKDLKSYYEAKENMFTLVITNHETTDADGKKFSSPITLNLSNIIKETDIKFPNFPYNDLKIPKSNNIIKMFYDTKLFGKKVGKKETAYSPTWSNIIGHIDILHVKDEFKRKVVKQAYLLNERIRWYLHTPHNIDSDIVMTKYRLDLGTIVKEDDVSDQNNLSGSFLKIKYNDVISEKKAVRLIKRLYNEVRKHVEGHTNDYNTFIVPQDFIDSRKRKRLSTEILKTTIPFTTSTSAKRSDERVNLKLLSKFKGKIFYTTTSNYYMHHGMCRLHETAFGNDWICHKDSDYVGGKYKIFFAPSCNSDHINTGIMFIRVSQGNIKYLEMLDNAYTIDKYIPLIFYRKLGEIKKAKKAIQFVENWSCVDNLYKMNGFEHINVTIAEKVKRAKEIVKKYENYTKYGFINMNLINGSRYINKLELEKAMENVEIEEQETLDYLIEVTKKNRSKIQWVKTPWNEKIEPKDDGHDDLIDILQLLVEE